MIRDLQKNKLWQFIKFALVGLSNTALGLAVYDVFIWINPRLYLWGNTLGWVISVFNAFYWNNRYVFRHAQQDWHSWLRRLGRNYLAYGATFLLGTLLLYIQVQWLGLAESLAPLINLVVTIPLNFLLNKHWAFKD